MKRYLKIFVTMTLCLTLMLSLATPVLATELKTAIGTVGAPSGLRLRAKPSTAAQTITVARDGDTVVVIRQVGDWYLVNYNLHIGYMHGDYLTLKDKSNVVLGDGSMDPAVTNVRSGPSVGSSRIDQLRRGQTAQIIGFNSGWYKVRYDDTTGYIRSDLVTLLQKPEGNKGSTATTNSTGSSASSSGSAAPTNSLGSQIATYAQQYVGYPYVYGGEDPSGFDCSGFVQYIYGQFGYSLNRTATAQLQNGYSVSYDELQPGDIIYFGTAAGTASHVGIYIGDGNFVHAQNSSTGVVITSLSASWYANRYLCAHRIVN